MSVRRFLFRLALGRRLPIASGELTVRGPRAPLTIRRDDNGVPHIEAQSDADACFGIGFVHGQDRAFQLETQLRVGRGTLAELVGPGALPVDRLSRRVGFRRASVAQLAVLHDDFTEWLAAYCAGVNAGHTVGLTKKPHEFALLGGVPTPYEPADVLAAMKLMSFALPSNYDVELARLRLIRSDGVEAMTALDPLLSGVWNPSPLGERGRGEGESGQVTDGSEMGPVPEESPSPLTPLLQGRGEQELFADLAAFQQYVPQGGGSNNWVIAGERCLKGKPILACDPHLGPSIPPPWYFVHVTTPDWSVIGATLAGTPTIPTGHNGFCAWGITAGCTDNADLFLETVGPDGASVRTADGTFARCEVIREVIAVKGKPDHIEDVLVTPRGPVISPLTDDVREAISLRAVWLDPLPVRGFVDVMRAKSFDEFRRPFEFWPGLPLNLVYADTSGTIGYQLAGQLPKRKSGFGTLPTPGDTPNAGWDGYVPFADMPHVRNPDAGFLATANDGLPHPFPDAPFVGLDFMDPYRADAIRDELAKAPVGWGVDDCLRLQRSVRSLPWEAMREIVLSVPAERPETAEAVSLLKAWTGHVDADSPAAAVFEFFVAELCVRVAKAKAPNGWKTAVGGRGGGFAGNLFGHRRMRHLIRLLKAQPAGWFARGWPAELADVLAEVIRTLRAKFGPSPIWWPWGHLRPLVLTHAVLGKHWLLKSVFNGRTLPGGGDNFTIQQAGVTILDPTRPVSNLPNLRTVFDTSDWSNSRFVLAGGQSGNPLSPHYADMLEVWHRGDALPIAYTGEEVLRDTVDTLRLLPGV